MKLNKSTLIAFALLIVIGSVFRLMGFAPQIAMAIFGAAVIKDKKLAFVLPLVSMFLSDVLYEVLFAYGYTNYGGFYEGQVMNYLLLAGITLIGFLARDLKWNNILLATLAAPTVFFFASNFVVWFGGGGLLRPKTFEGLMMSFADGLPFFRSSLVYTLIFSAVLFGGYFLAQRIVLHKKQLA
ncbi:MAG: DUF6580 family putative transport protein [Flavisolibacter sp.]